MGIAYFRSVIEHVRDLISKHGSGCWWSMSDEDLLPTSIVQKVCCCHIFCAKLMINHYNYYSTYLEFSCTLGIEKYGFEIFRSIYDSHYTSIFIAFVLSDNFVLIFYFVSGPP